MGSSFSIGILPKTIYSYWPSSQGGNRRRDRAMNANATSSFGVRRRSGIAAFGALALLAIAYFACPRHADLVGFDPPTMARLETAMWRHYYEKKYPALFRDLYDVSRHQGFSPLDSVRIALKAARAARAFQPTASRDGAQAALPELKGYFRILAGAAPVAVDIDEIARTELDWWQARRENVAPERYGVTIARVSSLLYGADSDDIRRAGVMRAQAMAYRDSHARSMSEADWNTIDAQLGSAYAVLKRAISAPATP
jgi:hypothetical protein